MRQKLSDTTRLLSSGLKPARIYQAYDQGDTRNCIFYAWAGMFTWNTGKIMTTAAVDILANKINPGKIPMKLPEIGRALSKWYDMYMIPKEDWTTVMNAGWGIELSLFPSDDFFRDAIVDGRIDEQHAPNLDQNHAVWMCKINNSVELVNSWKHGHQRWDITDDIDDLIQNGVIRGAGYVFTHKK